MISLILSQQFREAVMNLFSLLTHHTHYWGLPHERPADKRLIQICFVCGAERELKVELRPSRTLAKPQTVVPKMAAFKHA
jgi:hypothetical protein